MNQPCSNEDNGLRQTIRGLTPDRILDIAYCFYVLDTHEQPTATRKLAETVVSNFNRLIETAKFKSPEWEFLFNVKQIIVSLARGIGRRKQKLVQLICSAESKRETRVRRFAESARHFGMLRGAVQLVSIGGLTYAISRALVQRLHLGAGGAAQSNYVSLAAMFAFILIGSFVRSWLTNRRITEIYNSFEHDQNRINEEYQRGALEEYLRAKRDAAIAWQRYTGESAPAWPGFETEYEEQLELKRLSCIPKQGITDGFLQKARAAWNSWRGIKKQHQ